MLLWIPIIIIFLWKSVYETTGEIKFKDNGYTNILVAVRYRVNEEDKLRRNIETLFTMASEFLLKVTNGRAYFKEVTIAAPRNWLDSKVWEEIQNDPFPEADIKIDLGSEGNLPYTLQPGSCGEQGKYIHLTPEFINGVTNPDRHTEKFLIHEWMHYRYGIFDEYPISGDVRFPEFYFENSKLRHTGCTKGDKGYIENVSDEKKCALSLDGQLINCNFLTISASHNFSASLMYLPQVKEVLKYFLKNSSLQGATITLMTDGIENTEPYIIEVMPELEEKKVIVNTIAFGRDADEQLEELSRKTGGIASFVDDLNETRDESRLDYSFMQSITAQTDVDFRYIVIIDKIFNIKAGSSIDEQFVIESEIGNNTIINILCRSIKDISAIVIDPDGKRCDDRCKEYNKDADTRNRIRIQFTNSKNGTWNITIKNANKTRPLRVSLTVTSWPRDTKNQPLRISSWIEKKISLHQGAKVHAEVKKNGYSVIDATVEAKVERPAKGGVNVILKDDGKDADRTQDDGIYSGYFTEFTGPGRYTTTARMLNTGKARLVKKSMSFSPPTVTFITPEEGRRRGYGEPRESWDASEFELVENEYGRLVVRRRQKPNETESLPEGMTRVSDTTSFTFPGDEVTASGGDRFKIETVNVTDRTATLIWMAPIGVTYIELRADHDMDTLLNNFDETFLFNDTNVIDGTLDVLSPRQEQVTTIKMPQVFFSDGQKMTTVIIGMHGFNATGYRITKYVEATPVNFGLESRLKELYLNQKKEKQKEQEQQKEKGKQTISSIGKMIGIGLGVGITVVLVIVCALLIYFWRKNK